MNISRTGHSLLPAPVIKEFRESVINITRLPECFYHEWLFTTPDTVRIPVLCANSRGHFFLTVRWAGKSYSFSISATVPAKPGLMPE